MRILIKNGTIVTGEGSFKGSVLTEGNFISKIIKASDYKDVKAYNLVIDSLSEASSYIVEALGKIVMPGVIDTHVHFREPSLERGVGNIKSESLSAVLGGVTSFMDMPNNQPLTTSQKAIDNKISIAEKEAAANYAFYIGATENNIEELKRIDTKRVCGIKVFMGASTGGLLVEDLPALERIFSEAPILVVAHCEDNRVIKENVALAAEKYGDNYPADIHAIIRDENSCIESSKVALGLSEKYGTRFHLLHVTTFKEVELLRELKSKGVTNISAETCPHYLRFTRKDYSRYGNFIKCNPSIKDSKEALLQALREGVIDTVASDHAPHPLQNKMKKYSEAPSGMPMVEYSLQIMLQFYKMGELSIDEIVRKMCSAPARLFGVKKRGAIKEGYYADLLVINPSVSEDYATPNVLRPHSGCAWNPFSVVGDKNEFTTSIECVIINGVKTVENGALTGFVNSLPLEFER